jgi:two-component system LytT family response regulator
MKGFQVLIVDDELPARRKISSFLKAEASVTSIIEARDGMEAIGLIGKNCPDLVFLDIQMPGINGFEVIQKIGVKDMPPVIFVTAYDQYAINAFEVNAVDYLLKPFDQERFKQSLYRAMERINRGKLSSANDAIRRILEEVNQEKRGLRRILIKKGQRYIFVKTSDIMYISAEEKYVRLHTLDDTFLVRQSMNHLNQFLDSTLFIRIHRSYIVNVDYIEEVQPWSHGDYMVILKNKRRLKSSRRFKGQLFGKL